MRRRVVTRSQSASNLWQYVIGSTYVPETIPEVIAADAVVAEPDAVILHIVQHAASLGYALLEAMGDERVLIAFVLEPIDKSIDLELQRATAAKFPGRVFFNFEGVCDHLGLQEAAKAA